MNNVFRNLFALVGLVFVLAVTGCLVPEAAQDAKGTSGDLPAIEITPDSKFTPSGGISTEEARKLLIPYYKEKGVKGDIQSEITVEETTVKEIWENAHVQLFSLEIEYAWVHGTAVVKDGKVLGTLGGMPLCETFIADVDKDGVYEVYANVSFGSGIVSEDIAGYNIAKGDEYYLSERMKKDYKLFVEDGELMVNEYKYPYRGGVIENSGTGDGYGLPRDLDIREGKLVVTDRSYSFAVFLCGQETENNPLLTDRDIKQYIRETDTIVLKDSFLKRHPLTDEDKRLVTEGIKRSDRFFNLYAGSKLLDCSDLEKAAIVLNGERIYSLGFAMPAWSSRMPPEIYLADASLDSVRIHSTEEMKDSVKDRRIYDFFRQKGKLKE